MSQPEDAAEAPPFPPFSTFPLQVLRQTTVVELRLARNALEELPDAISALVNLKVLDVAGNRLTGFPKTLGTLTKLEELDASEVSIALISCQSRWGGGLSAEIKTASVGCFLFRPSRDH